MPSGQPMVWMTLARLDPTGRQLPDLLDADGVDLRVLPLPEVERLGELLDQRAARPFAEDHHLGADVDARLVVRLLLAGAGDALVAGAHADHAAVLDQGLGGGELEEDVDPGGLDLRGHPLEELAEGDDVVAVVLQRRRDGHGDGALLGQDPEHLLVRSISPSNGADFQSSGKSSLRARGSTTAPESAWLVISRPFSRTPIESSRPFVLGQPGEVAGPRQAGRPGAHEDDVQLQSFALVAH